MSRGGKPGGIGYNNGSTADGVTTTESQYKPIGKIDSPCSTARRTGELKRGGSHTTPRTKPGCGKGSGNRVIIDKKATQRSKTTTSSPVCRKITSKPQTMRTRTPSAVRGKRSPSRRTGADTNATRKEGGKRGSRDAKKTYAVDGKDGAVPARRPWGAGPGSRATCWSTNPNVHTLSGRASLSYEGQRGTPTGRGGKPMGSRGRDSHPPLGRSLPPSPPPPPPSSQSASLPGSVAIQRFLPTWTSLVAEAVWLRGSTRGGGGGDRGGDDANCAEISGGGAKRAFDANAMGGVSPPAVASLFYDLGFEVHQKGRGQCQRRETRGVTEEDRARGAKERAEVVVASCVDEGRVNGRGADGRGLSRQRAGPLPVPSLDPAVERLLMDWLRSRIDR